MHLFTHNSVAAAQVVITAAVNLFVGVFNTVLWFFKRVFGAPLYYLGFALEYVVRCAYVVLMWFYTIFYTYLLMTFVYGVVSNIVAFVWYYVLHGPLTLIKDVVKAVGYFVFVSSARVLL
jgi:hypothetical protein